MYHDRSQCLDGTNLVSAYTSPWLPVLFFTMSQQSFSVIPKTTQAVENTPHIYQGKGDTLVPSSVKLKAPPPQKGKELSMGIKRVAGLV